MLKFLGKITVYLVIVVCISLAVNTWYVSRVPSDLNVENDEQNLLKFENVPYEIEICNLGSSHGLFGYNYEEYEGDYTCFNFALESQTLSYDLRVLNHYKDHIAQGAIVYINLSYFTFFGVDETEEDSFEAKNQRYYRFLYPWEIKEYKLTTDMVVGRFRGLGAGIGEVVSVLNGQDIDAKEQIRETSLQENPISFETRWEMKADAYWVQNENALATYQQHLGMEKRNEDGSLCWNENEKRALYSIIQLCKEIGATPILVTTPLMINYNECINKAIPWFYDEWEAFISEVTDDEGIEYYDYSRDGRFQFDYDLFMNADHLNKDGATLFTRILIGETIDD